MTPAHHQVLSWLLCSSVLLGCDKDRPQPAPAVSIHAAQKSTQDDHIEFEGLKGPRPKTIDDAVTQERRDRIEAKVSAAHGFLVAPDVAAGLQEDLDVTTEDEALEKFDQQAAGHWVLFTGPINQMTSDGFALPVIWHLGSKRDKMAVTPSWFLVTFEQVQGHSTILVNEGSKTVVLAKYHGKKKASPAYDMVGVGLW